MRLIVLAACLLCLTMPAVLLADEIGATNKKDTTAAPTRREPAVCVGTFCYSIHSMSGRFASEEHDRMLAAGGGTEATEAAVQAALKWLESRQAVDGSWGFDHNRNTPPDVGDCPNPGTLDARYGATA